MIEASIGMSIKEGVVHRTQKKMSWKERLYKEVVILNSASHTYCVFESPGDLVKMETVIHRSGVGLQMSGKDLKETSIDKTED